MFSFFYFELEREVTNFLENVTLLQSLIDFLTIKSRGK